MALLGQLMPTVGMPQRWISCYQGNDIDCGVFVCHWMEEEMRGTIAGLGHVWPSASATRGRLQAWIINLKREQLKMAAASDKGASSAIPRASSAPSVPSKPSAVGCSKCKYKTGCYMCDPIKAIAYKKKKDAVMTGGGGSLYTESHVMKCS